MTATIRTRDVTVSFKGDAYAVALAPDLIASGWPGGIGVMWFDSPNDDFCVTRSDGHYGGFLLWGSDESSDQWTAMTGQQLKYDYGVMCAGGWLISTVTYERYTWASRHGPGPLVPNTFVVGQRVVFSLRGFFTPEDEPLISGAGWSNTMYIAYIVQPPRASNNWNLVVQTSL